MEQALHQLKREKRYAAVTFRDFTEAFDAWFRFLLMKSLEKHDLPQELQQPMKATCSKTSINIKIYQNTRTARSGNIRYATEFYSGYIITHSLHDSVKFDGVKNTINR